MPIAHHGGLFRRWPGSAGVINRADWRSQPLAAQPGQGAASPGTTGLKRIGRDRERDELVEDR